jgi:hypothetical protein
MLPGTGSQASPPSAPFSIRVLPHQASGDDTSPQPAEEQPPWLLPAAYRPSVESLIPARPDDTACIEHELNLDRLTAVVDWLWFAGRPIPPRPLHYQLLLGRGICVAERIDMHLVWESSRIFLKPIPRFLLEPAFWDAHLSCRGCQSPHTADSRSGKAHTDCKQGLRAAALGFLFSYTALVCHESDFLLAKEKYLLPAEVSWPAWRTLARQILETERIEQGIELRFIYGELRLSRLNKIYYLRRPFLRGYMAQWQQYGAFFRDNFAWLASATVYLAVVLTAMQVGLATSLADSDAFQSASYGFTIFSILGPLIIVGSVVIVFCCAFVSNWVEAVRYKRRRLRDIRTGLGG